MSKIESKLSESEPRSTKIDRLSAVYRMSGSSRRGSGFIFVGWTNDGRPAATQSLQELQPIAVQSLQAYQRSGLAVPLSQFTTLAPLEYAYTGQAIDFKDQGRTIAEDLINFGFKGTDGKTVEIAFGELSILGAIAQASSVWQDVQAGSNLDLAVTANTLYTAQIENAESAGSQGYAVLFKPVLSEGSNEATFKSFVRQTIGRLLVLDESQLPEHRKGYIDVAAKHAGEGNSAGILTTLQNAGLIELDPEWIKGMKRRTGGFVANLAQLGRSLGIVEVDDTHLDMMRNALPTYDIDSLDIQKLFDLSNELKTVAAYKIGRY